MVSVSIPCEYAILPANYAIKDGLLSSLCYISSTHEDIRMFLRLGGFDSLPFERWGWGELQGYSKCHEGGK